jgi:hypothetical protein
MQNQITALPALSRRDFSLKAALALLAGVVITIDGCGSNPAAPTPPVNDVPGTISNNHGHIATITSADITAGNAISLNIQGQASHPHTVDITQAELHTLKSRQAVAKDSTNNNGHMHTVTFTPA